MWVKLDDGFADHPKILSLSIPARWLHVSALVFCGRPLTDGFVRASVIPRLTDYKGLENVNVDALVDELVIAGLWVPVGGGEGYLIHDYLEYNPTRKEWLEKARRRSEAGYKAAKARWHPDGDGVVDDEDGGSNALSNANRIADRIATLMPRPVPTRPVPTRPLNNAR